MVLWSARKMLDGQCQRVNVLAHTRAAYSGLLQKRWVRVSPDSSKNNSNNEIPIE